MADNLQAFIVRLDGFNLSEDQIDKVRKAVREAVLSEISTMDFRLDTLRIRDLADSQGYDGLELVKFND